MSQLSHYSTRRNSNEIVVSLVPDYWKCQMGLPANLTKSPMLARRYMDEVVLSGPKQNFNLTESEFINLTKQLQAGDHLLFKTIFIAHVDDCVKYLQRKYSTSYDEAYDATMDTLLTFRRRIVEGKISYGNLRFLFTQMAGQHLARKLGSFRSREIEEGDLGTDDITTLNEADFETLAKAWNALSNECQELLRRNFYDQLKLSEIAELQQKSPAAVRKQKERCKDKLITLFNEQLSTKHE